MRHFKFAQIELLHNLNEEHVLTSDNCTINIFTNHERIERQTNKNECMNNEFILHFADAQGQTVLRPTDAFPYGKVDR